MQKKLQVYANHSVDALISALPELWKCNHLIFVKSIKETFPYSNKIIIYRCNEISGLDGEILVDLHPDGPNTMIYVHGDEFYARELCEQVMIWNSNQESGQGILFFDIPTSANVFVRKLDAFFRENLQADGRWSLVHLLDKNITEPAKFYLPTHGKKLETMLARGEAWFDERGGLILSTDSKFLGQGRPLEVEVIPTPAGITIKLDLIDCGELIDRELYDDFINFLENMAAFRRGETGDAELLAAPGQTGGDGKIPETLLSREKMKPYCPNRFNYVPRTAKTIIEALPRAKREADQAYEDLTVTRLANEAGVVVETASRYLTTIKNAGFTELLGVKLPGK